MAYAVAMELGVSFDDLEKLRIDMPRGRNRTIKYGSLMILDETYNASPEAVHASLEMLLTIPGRRCAVLGKMLDLGESGQHFKQKYRF